MVRCANRLVHSRRTLTVTFPDGRTTFKEYIIQKHPVSTWEVEAWLEKHGFRIEGHFGRDGAEYTAASSRTTFWARKSEPLQA